MGKSVDIEVRFWGKVDKTNDCWEWQGPRTPEGYGTIYYNGRVQGAHRVSVILSGREIPPKMLVCHKCDNPGCVNPEHLYVGSGIDNASDMSERERGYGQRKWLEMNPNHRMAKRFLKDRVKDYPKD